MHGSAALFDGLRAHAPAGLTLHTVDYPSEGPQDYGSLQAWLEPRLPSGETPYAIVAESFSGPLAVRIAAAEPRGLAALVLVNSFVAAPMGPVLGAAAMFGMPLASRLGVPARAIRARMVGADAPDARVARVGEILRGVPRATLAARMTTVARANETSAYLRTWLPIFYLRSDADRLVPERALAEMIRIRPGLQVHRTPGPHLLLQRHPERAAEVLQLCLSDRG